MLGAYIIDESVLNSKSSIKEWGMKENDKTGDWNQNVTFQLSNECFINKLFHETH